MFIASAPKMMLWKKCWCQWDSSTSKWDVLNTLNKDQYWYSPGRMPYLLTMVVVADVVAAAVFVAMCAWLWPEYKQMRCSIILKRKGGWEAGWGREKVALIKSLIMRDSKRHAWGAIAKFELKMSADICLFELQSLKHQKL